MTHCEKHTVEVETDASGDFVGYTDAITGLLNRIQYVKDDLDSGTDIAITIEDTGESLWVQNNVSASAVVAPRIPTHISSGAGALYAAGGATVNDKIAIAKSRIKVVIAEGGNVKSGTFNFFTE